MLRRAYTLVEILLAMSLSAVVLGALWMALDFQLRALDNSRASVEEAQLARTLLHQIANDLRSAIYHAPSTAAANAAAQLGSAASAADASGVGSAADELLAGSGTDAANAATATVAEDAADSSSALATSVVVSTMPGIYGSLGELQVDLSRLPRIDQYERALVANAQGGSSVAIPSDVKTITYYVQPPTQGSGGLVAPGGLVRRELSRAVASWAGTQGDTTQLLMHDRIIAPEVQAMQLAYFDGASWSNDWDTAARQTLPIAVEIALMIGLPTESEALLSPGDGFSLSAFEGRVYRLLVYLPTATATPTAGATEASDSNAASASSASGSSSSSSSGSGATP